MAKDPRAIIERWFEEVWNQGREETIDELMAPDAVAHGLGEQEGDVRGPEEFKVFWKNLRGAIPDLRIRVEDAIVEGDKISARATLTGTHHGHTLGVPASGRRVQVSGVIVTRLSGGKIVEGWNSWDQLGLLRQIGAIPDADAGDRFLSRKA